MTHACGVCWRDAEDHSGRECCPDVDHMTPPCCEGCGCGWFEENHPQWIKATGTNRSGRMVNVGDLIVMAATNHVGRPGQVLGEATVQSGGSGHRRAFKVYLFARGKAPAKTIQCWPSSTNPAALIPADERTTP